MLDVQGRRIGKKINGKLDRIWLYQSQLQIAAELDGNGQLLKRFVYGSKSHVPDYMIIKGKAYRIITDQLGSPRVVVNSVTGRVVQSFEFDDFGNRLDRIVKDELPFGFAGGLHDYDTGLVHFGAREYDPEVGRWTTKDPIRFDGGDLNLYGYVLNDPVNFVDPSGLLTSQDISKAINKGAKSAVAGAVIGGTIGICLPTAVGVVPGAVAGAVIGGLYGAGSVLIPALTNEVNQSINSVGH